MKAILYAGDDRALETAWLDWIAAPRPRGPLAPRWTVVPNHLIGQELLALATRRFGAWAGLRAVTLDDLARRLAEPVFAAEGRREIGPLARRLVIASLVRAADLAYLGPLVGRRGLVETLDALFADLEEGGMVRFPDLPPGVLPRAKERDLRALYDAFRAEVTRVAASELDLYAAARAQAGSAAAVLGTDSLALFGFADVHSLQRELLAALAGPLSLAFFASAGDGEPEEHARALLDFLRGDLRADARTLPATEAHGTALELLRERLFADAALAREAVPGDGTVHLYSVADEVREAREAVRDVLAAASDGVPFPEIAIVTVDRDTREIVREELARAGVPAYVDGGVPATTTPEGLALSRLGAALAGPWRRPEMMALLRLSPPETAPGPSGEALPVDADRWDAVSRAASIAEGAETWEPRLAAFEASVAADADGRADHVAAFHLRAHLAPLLELRRLATGRTPLPDLAAATHRAVTGLVRESTARAEFLGALAALVADPTAAKAIGPGDLFGVLTALGEDLTLPGGRFREGTVALLPIERARHLGFARVLVVGLAPGRFKAIGTQDPLLGDDERRAINARAGAARLPPKGDRRAEQDYHVRRTIAAAREALTVTFPRADRRTGRRRVPSALVVRLAEALSGKLGEDAFTACPGFVRLPAAPPADIPESRLVDLAEWEATRIAPRLAAGDARAFAGVLGLSPRVGDTFRRRRERVRALLLSGSLSAYDGALEGAARARAAARAATEGELSASRLESYAACPRLFLLRYALGLRPIEEPAARLRLPADERGAIVHRALHRAFEEADARGELPLDAARADEVARRIDRLVRREGERLAASGRLGEPVLWDLDRGDILADARAHLRREATDAAYRPRAFEVRFGAARAADAGESPLSTDASAVLDLGDGRALRFAGRIDRIDFADGGGVRVIDYKTGRGNRPKGRLLAGGEMLQLPVYRLAAMQRFPVEAGDGTSAYYFYVTRRGGFRKVGLDADEGAATEPDLRAIARAIADGIAAGLFFPSPRGVLMREQCRGCDYRPYCGPAIGDLAERKEGDPARVSFMRMKEVP